MKKFKVVVTRVSEYEVEVDETIWNAQEQKNWEKAFYRLPFYSDDNEDPDTEAAGGFAEALAKESCNQGLYSFIEGFGYCVSSKEDADMYDAYASEHKVGYRCTRGLYINETDTDYICDTKEIKE